MYILADVTSEEPTHRITCNHKKSMKETFSRILMMPQQSMSRSKENKIGHALFSWWDGWYTVFPLSITVTLITNYGCL